jgi:hypothetical protein
MKNSILAILLIISQLSFSQNGKITLKAPYLKPGEENTFLYTPKEDNQQSEKLLVNYVYIGSQKETTPLIKKGTHFEFSLKVPDSIKVLMVSINSPNNKVVDNNSGKGYAILLKNNSKKERRLSNLEYLKTWRYSNYYLKTKITPKEIIAKYEKVFQENKKVKKTDIYRNYLYLKYDIDKEKTKPELIKYADKFAKKRVKKIY